jgi:8-oxo-dGTP pyrophosphatase MutT (NUDIX family)
MSRPEASVAIVQARLPEPSILLIRRTEREDDSWSGHWSFPGGRREPGDAEPLETALRELAEECGITLSQADLVEELPLAVARRRTPPFLEVTPFVLGVERALDVKLDPREAVEARWIPLSLLRNPSSHSIRPVPGMPPRLFYPVVELNAVPLWGFTYRLITEWQKLLPADRRAGFEVACRMLEFLLAHGLRLARGWRDRTTVIEGALDPEEIAAYLAQPAAEVPPVNRVELTPKEIRVMGLAFEEYLIRSTG